LLVAAFWAKKKKIPVVISEHWSGYMRGMFDAMPYWRKWAYKRLGKVNRILPVSTFLQDNMQRCGIQGKYQVLPNVVEENAFTGKKRSRFSFLMIADLVDNVKNVSGVIRAFDQIAKRKSEAELHLIGGGPDESELRKLASQMTNAERIHFYGRLPNSEVKRLLPEFHCLVVNSRVESFGVVLLEAHAGGLPAIVTRCGGPEEWVEEGDISIAVDDRTALHKAMLDMMLEDHNTQFTKWKACLPQNISSQLQEVYVKVFHENQRMQKRKKKKAQ
jgi:glycosyltransferase involved in cell wall biosynthesis